MQSKSASMSLNAVMQYGETSLDLFLHKRFKSFWLPGIIITYHILEIQKTQGFLFILKHSDTFYLSNLCFVLYNKSVCYCISLVTVEKKAIKAGYSKFLVFFMLKSGQFWTHPQQTCCHNSFLPNLMEISSFVLSGSVCVGNVCIYQQWRAQHNLVWFWFCLYFL